MRRAAPLRSALGACLASAALFGCTEDGAVTLQQASVDVVGFELVSERELAPTVTESTYRLRCRADAGPYEDAVAFVSSDDIGVQIVDGVARCGRIGLGQTVASAETIVLNRDPARAFDPAALGWITLAYGDHTRVASEPAPGGARLLRYEVEVTDATGRAQGIAAGASSADAAISVTDGIVTAATQRVGTVRNSDGFEVLVAPGATFRGDALVWSLSRGTRSEFALGVTRTLDGAGQPLGDVRVEEQGPAGAVERSSDPESGIATLAEQAGDFHWKFSRGGHLPVWREGSLAPGQVLFVPSPWLAERNPAATTLSVLNGGDATGEGATVRFAAGAFPAPATATLTPIGVQSLPGLLPPGWSPLSTFWLELSVEPSAPGQAELRLADRLAPGERSHLVRFDTDTRRWTETGAPVAASGDLATVAIARSGAYAIVVPDAGSTAPPEPVAGAALAPSATPFPLPDGLGATGTVVPPVAAASADPVLVTAQSEVVVTHAGLMPSGMVLRADVDEQYVLRDGTTRAAPSYETFFVAFQRPGDDDPHTLHARFPLRPQIALAPEELDEATVALDVLPVASFEGGFFDPSGGRVGAPGVLITAAAGAVDRPRAVELRAIGVDRFADFVPPGAALVAFELSAELAAGGRVGASFGPQPPDSHFVLTRFVQSGGRSGLEPRQRYASDSFGVLRSVEPASGPRLPGVTGSGTYVLVEVDGPRALVEGVARDTTGQATGGLAVTIEDEPWLTFSAVDGRFQLVAPIGDAQVVVTDLRNGDRGVAGVFLADPGAVAATDLGTQPAGPRVVELDPADGATGVRPSSPITVIFSERVAPLAPGDLVLTDAVGNVVPTTLSSNLARTEATLLPINPLATGALHTLTLADTIADPAGLLLEGERSFTFTTQSLAARGAGAQLVSWEPGAQTSECDGVPGIDRSDPSIVCVIGSQGTADPDVPVILVNDTTGETATVRSRLDGSFESFIDAAVDDFVSATFVNGNGTRIRIPVQRQLFDDGSVALFEGGGILEAESDGGPVQILVQPGSIASKTKFKIDPIPIDDILALMQSSPPEGGKLLSGVTLTLSGDVPTESPEVVLPVDEADLELPPGEDPTSLAFALAGVTDSADGGKAYQVVDKLHYEDGRLVTRSFPFIGMLALIGSAVAEEFATIVITAMFLGDDAITTTGIVGACQLSPVTDECIGESGVSSLVLGGPAIRPLPGAVVIAQPFEPGGGLPPIAARPGRIPIGAMYAVADDEGRYVLALPLYADSFGTLGREQAYQLVATHPRFSQPTADVVSFDDFNLLNPLQDRVAAKDLLFRVSDPFGSIGSAAVAGRPRLSIGHSPARPAPNESGELRVFASHRNETPSIDVSVTEISSLVVGEEVDLADLTLTIVSDVETGSNARRQEWSITAAKPLAAKLRVVAAVDGFDPAVTSYPIHFGGAPPPVVDPVRSADPNDERGPLVMRTWPAEDSEALAPGEPIVVVFNEPVSKALEEDPAGIVLAPEAGTPRIELDATQRQATIRFPELRGGTPYTLTLTSPIRDLAEPPNDLDQDPTSAGPDAFQLRFATTPIRTSTLSGVTSGGGALLHGDYAFVLDRTGPGNGELRVFSLANPSAPLPAGGISLPGFPRDMVLLPNYSFRRKSGAPVETRDMIAVVGGDLGAGSDEDGNFGMGNAYLNLFDVTNPESIVRLGGALLSQSAETVPTKVAWSPPLLSYLLSGGSVQTIEVLNLQTFLIGTFASAAERAAFPEEGEEGDDANQDGDFVDEDDVLPLPLREPIGLDGKAVGFLIDDTTQRILDYAFDASRLQLALALDDGVRLSGTGQPTNEVIPAGYRTYANNGVILPRVPASVALPGTRPKRVHVLYGVQTRDAAGLPLVADLALVSLAPESEGPPSVAVIDITNPENPILLTRIELPSSFGIPQSVSVRDDGAIVLAATSDLLLLDADELAQPQPEDGDHPALLGLIDGAGSGARASGTEASGLSVVSLGGRSQLVQTAPTLAFVQFPNEPQLVDPEILAGNETLRDARLSAMAFTDALVPGRVEGVAGATESLDPPSAAVHYHVLVRAPGSAGTTIELGLESLDKALRPIGRKGFHFAPSQAMREETLSDLGQAPSGNCNAPTRSLEAFRLDSDPTSPLYDLYLSRPFALTVEEVKPAVLANLRDNPKREILWSGDFVAAFVEPNFAIENDTLEPWGAEVREGRLYLRANAIARALPGDYIAGPNPPPANGWPEAPGTMGSVAAHSGEFRAQTLDLAVDTRLLPIVFERFSGSQDLFEGPFGRGWDFEYNQRLVELREDVFPAGNLLPLVDRGGDGDEIAESKDLVFHTGEGRSVVYGFASSDAPPPEYAADPLLVQLGWIAEAAAFYLPKAEGVFDALVRFQDGTFGRLTPDGMQFRYDPEGRLAKIYHRYEENALELHYNGHGELIRVEETADPRRFIDVGWHRLTGDSQFRNDIDVETSNAYHDGKIARLVDFTGRDVLFHYDATGLLERREGVDVQTTRLGGEPGRANTSYLSGACTEQDSANNLTGIVPDTANGTALFTVSSFGPGDQDIVSAGTGIGGAVQIDLSHANSAAALASGGGGSTITEADGSGTAMQLDTRGQLRVVTLSGEGAPPSTYGYDHKPDGRVERVVEPAGNSVEYVYDDDNENLRSRGNLVEIRLRAGPLPGGDFDAVYSYDPIYNQRIGSQEDFNGFTLDYAPTDGGRQVGSITYPQAGIESFTFDEFGQTLTHSLPEGAQRGYEYDPQTGHLLVESRGDFDAHYDYQGGAGDRGRPTKITPARGAETHVVYDELDRPVEVRRGAYVEEFGYDPTGRIRTQSRTTEVGAKVVTTNTYDARGFRTSSTVEGVEVDGAAVPLATVFTPDALGRVHVVQRPGGVVETLEYDHTDQIRSRTFGDMITTIERDPNGHPSRVRTGELETTYVYDAHDRLHRSVTPTLTTTYEYYGNGEPKRVVVEDADGLLSQIEWEIDSLGRVTRQLEQSDGAPAETRTTYSGPVTTITDPAQQVTTLTRGTDGFLRSVTTGAESVTYGVNGQGSVETETSVEGGNTYVRTFAFDDLDHPTSMEFGGVTTSFTPRPDGAVTSVTNGLANVTLYPQTVLGEPAGRVTPEGVGLAMLYAAHRESSGIDDAEGPALRMGFDTSLRQTLTQYRDGNSMSFGYEGPSSVPRPSTITIPGGSISPSFDLQGRLLGQSVEFGGTSREETYGYDGLGRVTSATYPGGSTTFDYDRLGPLRQARFDGPAGVLTVDYEVRSDRRRASLTYPSALLVTEQRDEHGRLEAVLPSSAPPVIDSTDYAAADLVGSRTYGGGAVIETNDYDARKRLVARRYVNGAGVLLAEERLVYDAGDNVVARQHVHRGGRADFFVYDRDDRLVRADMGARPALDVEEGGAPIAGFGVPAGVPGSWSRGFFAREFGYDGGGLDLFESATPVDPDGLAPAFARTLSTPDANLQITEIDFGSPLGNFSRGPSDTLGHTTRSLLLPPPVAGAVATPVAATLEYDGLNHLVRVERDDGARIEYGYETGGIVFRRTVDCNGTSSACVPSDRVFVNDGGRRLEERDAGSGDVVARFYYADGDYPIAADLPAAGGGLERHYLLVDSLGSVMAITDASGTVVERIHYDTYGTRTVEAPDTQPPVLSRITTDASGALLIEFSERVVGALGTPPPGAALATDVAPIESRLRVRQNGVVVTGTLRFEESREPFGTTFRFEPDAPLAGTLRIELDAAAVADEWNNANPASATVEFPFTSGAGAVLFTGAASGSTASAVRGRSATGSSAGFHGHFYDEDTGLVYMRARFYDPLVGLFLQRDPVPYEDSVNPYAAFGHSPATLRDPTGAFLRRWLVRAASKAPRLGGALLRGYDGTAAALAKLLPKRMRRLNGQVADNVQPIPKRVPNFNQKVRADFVPGARSRGMQAGTVSRPKRVEDLVREAAAGKRKPLRGLIVEIADDDVIEGATDRMIAARPGAVRARIQSVGRHGKNDIHLKSGDYDYVTFVAHGDGPTSTIGGWTAEQLGARLKSVGITARRFEISACNSGSCSSGVDTVYDLVDSFAAKLARATRRPVDASASLVITDEKGVIRSVKSMMRNPGSADPDDLVVDQVEGTKIFHVFLHGVE